MSRNQGADTDDDDVERSIWESDKPLSERLKVGRGEGFDPIPPQLLRKYIAYARKYVHPNLTKDAATVLQVSLAASAPPWCFFFFFVCVFVFVFVFLFLFFFFICLSFLAGTGFEISHWSGGPRPVKFMQDQLKF